MNKEELWLLKEKYNGQETVEFFNDCKRLTAGEPVSYVIGFVPFLDCQIALDSRPLIPRPETEFWVEQAITTIKTSSPRGILGTLPRPKEDEALQVLDLCAGSGAIGVAVAKAISQAWVTFAEIDPAHLPTIEKNLHTNLSTSSINRTSGEEKYIVAESDLFENVAGQYDFILTNPPYIDKEANTVEASVTTHEPHLALFGGVAGMEIIRRILKGAKENLTVDGQLWIEHEPFQKDAMRQLAKEYGFNITTHLDQYGTDRYSVLIGAVAQ